MTRPDRARNEAAVPATMAIPGRWAERALCVQADPDAWLPDKGQRGLAGIAKRIFGRCPVRTQCLDYALSGADTWGGIPQSYRVPLLGVIRRYPEIQVACRVSIGIRTDRGETTVAVVQKSHDNFTRSLEKVREAASAACVEAARRCAEKTRKALDDYESGNGRPEETLRFVERIRSTLTEFDGAVEPLNRVLPKGYQ
jgi:WhiB family redox-sensing transcriptional regulator